MPVAKRSASVAPEVDLGECTLHSPLQKANKAEPTLALNPRGDVTRKPKKGYQWPQKRTCVSAKNFFFKKSLEMSTSTKVDAIVIVFIKERAVTKTYIY